MTTETQHNPVPKRTRRGLGLTLLETVVAIVVGLVVLGGVGALVYSATSKTKMQTLTEEMGTIVGNIHTLFHDVHISSDITWDQLRDAGIFPPTMLDSSGHLRSPWGGPFYAYILASSGAHIYLHRGFGDDSGIGKEPCVKIAQRFKTKYGFYRMYINGTDYELPASQPTLAEITSKCVTGNDNGLRFVLFP